MELEEIVQQLQHCEGVLPRQALRAAMTQQDAITPELLKILVYARDHAQDLLDEPDYTAHIYALYLLAQFREPRAYPVTVDFFSLPGDVSLDLTGGLMSTASGLVFTGDNDGYFYAFDASTGKELWKYSTGAPVWGSAAVTYMLDGRQYVLTTSGLTFIAFALPRLDLR